MTTKKAVTMIYKHLNFKNDRMGKAKLFKSVAHSLRIAPNETNQIISTKILEWDEDKSDQNLLWASSVSSKIIKLNSLTDEQKKTIQESFIHKVDAEQKSKNDKTDAIDALSKYKAKVNKFHNSINDDSDELKIFLSKILEEKEAFDVDEEISQLTSFEFSRKNQKTETVRKFLNLHNEVIENKADIARNKIFIQEAFFKIPAHNNVHLKAEDMMLSIASFYSKNFPDYPVKLIVYHGDEVGNHPHIFVEAKNKRTNKYDLLNAQKQFVNDNIDKVRAEYSDAEKLDFSNRSYSAKKIQAQYFQTLFYQHTNKMLLQYDVEAKKLDKTKEHNERMRKIEEDAKKPKIEREASFYNAQMNDLKEQNKALHEENKALTEDNKSLSKSNAELTESVESKNFSIKILDDKIEYKKSVLDNFKQKLTVFTESIFSYVKTFFESDEIKQSEARSEASKKYQSLNDTYEKLFADEIIEEAAENLNDENAEKLRAIKLEKLK